MGEKNNRSFRLDDEVYNKFCELCKELKLNKSDTLEYTLEALHYWTDLRKEVFDLLKDKNDNNIDYIKEEVFKTLLTSL